jgi:hypothetical protein
MAPRRGKRNRHAPRESACHFGVPQRPSRPFMKEEAAEKPKPPPAKEPATMQTMVERMWQARPNTVIKGSPIGPPP